MKKSVLMVGLLASLFFVAFRVVQIGCKPVDKKESSMNEYEIEIIDACEYVKKFHTSHTGYTFAHKGNCKYCMERNKQMVNECIRNYFDTIQPTIQ